MFEGLNPDHYVQTYVLSLLVPFLVLSLGNENENHKVSFIRKTIILKQKISVSKDDLAILPWNIQKN